MSWRLDHIDVVSYDVRRSAEFYSAIFGMREHRFPVAPGGEELFSTGPESLANFPEEGDGGRLGLHVAAPDTSIAKRLGWWMDPIVRGHFALTVDDIFAVKRNLDARGIDYLDMGEWAAAGRYQIYVYDPSKNIIEVNQTIA